MPRTIARTVDAEVERVIISFSPLEILVEWSEEERGQSGAIIRREGQPIERIDQELTPGQRAAANTIALAVRAVLRTRYSGSGDR